MLKEIIKLHEMGLGKNKIARSLQISVTTVKKRRVEILRHQFLAVLALLAWTHCGCFGCLFLEGRKAEVELAERLMK